jgi:hypothetical protein
MIEAGHASETSVIFYETIRRNIPADCYLTIVAVRTLDIIYVMLPELRVLLKYSYPIYLTCAVLFNFLGAISECRLYWCHKITSVSWSWRILDPIHVKLLYFTTNCDHIGLQQNYVYITFNWTIFDFQYYFIHTWKFDFELWVAIRALKQSYL